MRARWSLLASVLACAGCSYDWKVGSGSVDGSAGTARLNDIDTACPSTCTCPAGKKCSFSCTSGGCALTCEPGSECELGCPGGGCTTVCSQNATCTSACTGSGCGLTCEPGSTCTSSCLGGGCSVRCRSASCSQSCLGGACDCTTEGTGKCQ